MRTLTALLALSLLPFPSFACSFCRVDAGSLKSLSIDYRGASAVVFGTYKNGKLGRDLTGGTTEFHIDKVLQSHALLTKDKVFIVPRYIPGETKSIIFLNKVGEQLTVSTGYEANEALVEHLNKVMKLDPKDTSARLAYYYQHLDSPNAEIAMDAFVEFALAPDSEIIKARDRFDPKKLVTMLRDPKTMPAKLGMLAMMLGMCGKEEHIAVFRESLKSPLQEPVLSNLGGYLCGWVLLEPNTGWAKLDEILLDSKVDAGIRLSAIGAVRFFQTNRAKELREKIVASYERLIWDTDIVDLAIEDLRRWEWWDLHDDIYKAFDAPSHSAPVIKRSIVRYALTANDQKSKEFVNKVRKSDPALVAKVEERMKSQ